MRASGFQRLSVQGPALKALDSGCMLASATNDRTLVREAPLHEIGGSKSVLTLEFPRIATFQICCFMKLLGGIQISIHAETRGFLHRSGWGSYRDNNPIMANQMQKKTDN